MLIEFRGRLNPIDPTKFEAKRPRQDPYSHGYRYNKHKTKLRIPHAFEPQGPGELKMLKRTSGFQTDVTFPNILEAFKRN